MKLYNEKEIGAILQKAAENSQSDDSSPSVGLTKGELEQLAADAGIDPDQIGRAIAELTRPSQGSEWSFWGGPFSYNDRLQLDGEISSGQWEDMLVSIRECFKVKGEVTVRDTVREWSSPWSAANSAQVTARTDDGSTKVSVSWNGPLTAVPFYLPVPVAMVASTPIAVEALQLTAFPGISFILAVGAVTFMGGRWALRRHLNKVFKGFRQMTASFESDSQATPTANEIAQPESVEVQSPTEVRLEIDETDHADVSQATRTAGRSRE